MFVVVYVSANLCSHLSVHLLPSSAGHRTARFNQITVQRHDSVSSSAIRNSRRLKYSIFYFKHMRHRGSLSLILLELIFNLVSLVIDQLL